MDLLSPLLALPSARIDGEISFERLLKETLSHSPYLQGQNLDSLSVDFLKDVLEQARLPDKMPSLPDDALDAQTSPEKDVGSRFEEVRQELATAHDHVDRMVDLGSVRASTQSQIVLLCENGGVSGGRFQVLNSTESKTDVVLHVQSGKGVPDHIREAMRVSFEPGILKLEAGEVSTVHMNVDLRGCTVSELSDVEFRIEAHADGSCLSVCWVTVKLV